MGAIEIKDIITDFKNAFTIMKAAKSVAVTMHIRPDGDSIGSSLAMQEILESMGKKRVDVFTEGPPPTNFLYLSGCERIIDINTFCFDTKYDLLLVMDLSDEPRMGSSSKLRTISKKVIVIDHHLNPTIDANIIVSNPQRASTGEIVYEFCIQNNIEITKTIAESLYTAVSSDTGCFLFPSTTPFTHIVASELLKMGIDFTEINYNNFQAYDRVKLASFLKVLRRIRFHKGGEISSIRLSRGFVKKYDFNSDERHRMQRYATDARGVKVSIFMTERERNIYNVSLRSKGNVNVAAVAKQFGGGGHKNAAGITAYGKYKVLIKKILEKVEEVL